MRERQSLVAAMIASAVIPTVVAAAEPVQVVVDMDLSTPGFQHRIDVPQGVTTVEGIGIYVVDPTGGRSIWGIGYLGGIDRGIAFGHAPAESNAGVVEAIEGRVVQPVNPESAAYVVTEPAIDEGFEGLEVQYVEYATHPAPLPTSPSAPLVEVDVHLAGTEPGDAFDFHLLDFVTVWTEGAGGAFSTQDVLTLDTGGDAVPDGTVSLYGVDPDGAIPAPPAAFPVDYVDGPGHGPAVIAIVAPVSTPLHEASGASSRLLPSTPNPFRSTATIRYALRAAGFVRLEILDVAGRSVRTLLAGSAAAGVHEAQWDGRDARGRPVASGVYVYRLAIGGRVHVGRGLRVD